MVVGRQWAQTKLSVTQPQLEMGTHCTVENWRPLYSSTQACTSMALL
jgi:hypothetical protein